MRSMQWNMQGGLAGNNKPDALAVLAAEHPALILLTETQASQFDYGVLTCRDMTALASHGPKPSRQGRGPPGKALQSSLLIASGSMSESGNWLMTALMSSWNLLCSCQVIGQHIWQCATYHPSGDATATLSHLMTCRGIWQNFPWTAQS